MDLDLRIFKASRIGDINYIILKAASERIYKILTGKRRKLLNIKNLTKIETTVR